MIAHKYQYKDRQKPETMVVIPASAAQAEQIQALAGEAYGISPEAAREWFGADQYRSRIEHFPEGQFVALDESSGRLVGLTSSMRFRCDPVTTFLEDWDRTTGYG